MLAPHLADVAISFVATLQEGFNYADHTHAAGEAFTFWFIGEAAAGFYRNTELNIYCQYAETISINVNIHFEVLPTVA
jgi:hypothetical protein